MDKGQGKVRKDKKKNTQTGMLMGQNTNVFSQLSATYLQNKTQSTEEQTSFVNSTQIIQYHDPNINRIIALLRKKADVTKAKAALQLREQVIKMEPETLQQFLPTFSQLYLQVIINEQSKQVIDEFILMLNHLMTNSKKLVIKEISTLYAPLLVSNKFSAIPFIKGLSILFNGTDEQILQKALTLLMKKQVQKKFIVFCKIILQCEQTHKIGQQNYQRNCSALVKVVKDFLRCYDTLKGLSEEVKKVFSQFIIDIDELLDSKTIKQYFKVGGKAKGSILQLYQGMIGSASYHPDWKIEWEKYAKVLCQNYLQKDLVVQQTLWKHCNRQFVESCLRMEKEGQKQRYSIFVKLLPKPDEKLMSVLKLGGLSMYRQLVNYLKIFPFTVFEEGQSHKNIINKLTFVRKLVENILQLQDENETRIQTYYEVGCLLMQRLIEFKKYFMNSEQKKQQQICVLITKTQKQIVQNLQHYYYANPPASRNSFSYYIPAYFCKLICLFQLQYTFVFNQHHTFNLYNAIEGQSQFIKEIKSKIFNNCKENTKLTLTYLENFSAQPIDIDMSENNKEVDIASKTFLLSTRSKQHNNWFLQDWDMKKQIIVYDPRITKQDLTAAQQNNQKLNYYFKPSHKVVHKLYDNAEHDSIRLKYFINCLKNPQYTQVIPMLIPFIRDKLMVRNKQQCLLRILQVYAQSAQQLQNRKWMVGEHQVLKVRVTSDLIIQAITNDQSIATNSKLLNYFLTTCFLFSLSIHNYKMEDQSEELLKIYSKLSFIETYRERILESVRKSINQAYLLFSKLDYKNQKEDKIRKNRLTRCLNFIKKVLWHCGQKLQSQHFIQFFKDLLNHKNAWKESLHRPDMWLLTQCLLSIVSDQIKRKLCLFIISQHQQYSLFIGLMMCCQIILPLQRQPQAKKTCIEWQNTIIKCILQSSAQVKISVIREMVSNSLTDNSFTVMYGTKYLLKSMMKNYEVYEKKVLYEFMRECIEKPLQTVEKGTMEDKLKATLLLNNLCVELPLLDIEEINETYNKVNNKVKETDDHYDVLIYASITTSMWEVGIGFKEFQNQNVAQFINKLYNAYQQSLKQTNDIKVKNFITYAVLIICNSLYPLQNKDKSQKWNFFVNQLLWVNLQQGSFLSGIVQSNRMKFISRSFLTLQTPLKAKIAQSIPIQGLKQLTFYGDILDQIQVEDQSSIPHHQNTITMFIEFAQVLIKIASGLSPEVHPNQKVMLGLLQCPFPGIKRTSFLLLKQMYELNLVQKAIPSEFEKYLNLQHIGDEEIEWVIGQITCYLYSWQTLFSRRIVQKSAKGEDEYNINLQDYLLKDLLYEKLLKNIFEILQNQLQFNKRQQQYNLSAEELVSTDTVIVSEDELNLAHKLYRLTLRTLFLFILNFPLFLKEFMDHNKKYKNICDRLLRNILSDAIFKQQILKIQMQQHEWKSMGNFEIFVTPKNKQIYAQYTHDTIRIGLRLVMRSNYPLTPIAIQFGDGLKIQDGSRWSLMLQTQLHSRNNTIINGILLWKENIDNRLSGVQQCSICFDIVNNSGQLPKKSCKTCHKKFHGNCIMRWFSKSNKSQCPLCKSQFL